MISQEHYNIVPTNVFLSAGASALAFVTSVDPIVSVGLPVLFFLVGKTVDVVVKLYLEKRRK